MIKNKFILFLFLIIGIASVVRLYDLGNVPPSPNWDEASLGYNAFSIMQTGRDEFGDFLPVILRSFDDYKPALYTYFAIPTIKFFGLSTFAVRLPSSLMGIGSVILLYFLTKQIISKNKFEVLNSEIDVRYLALTASLLLAISPWHIQFSRIAFEANAGLFLNLLAVFLFLVGLKKPIFMVFSFFIAGLNIHMYQSEKVFTPLVLGFFSLLYYRQLLKIKKWYIISLFVAVLVTVPFFIYLLSNPNALLRAKGVSVFSDQTNVLKISAEKLIYDQQSQNLIGYVFDNRRIEFVKLVISGYIAHFDLNWLFITGDIGRHHAPNMGLFYLFELPFLLFGIYLFIFSKIEKRIKLLVIGYLLLVPIPASITSGVPHAVRTINFLGVIQIVEVFGWVGMFLFINKKKMLVKNTVFAFSIGIVILNFSYYLNQYFVQLNYFTSKDWLYGYKEAIEYIKPRINEYDKIVVTNKPPLDQSYMFFLFHLQYPPQKYLEEGGTKSGGFREENGFANFVFTYGIDLNKYYGDRVLYVGIPGDFPTDMKIHKKVNYLNNEPAIIISSK